MKIKRIKRKTLDNIFFFGFIAAMILIFFGEWLNRLGYETEALVVGCIALVLVIIAVAIKIYLHGI
ncbi:MAG: hypothetical protein LBQ37_00760 [Elusimicrobiota bacterium]|nr:hypothetical protein [Elusimicrobiota bacterium]